MDRKQVEEAIRQIRAGRMILLTDAQEREDEGDLIIASDHVTPEAITFMARFGCGLICVPMTPQRALELRLYELPGNKDLHGTAFTISVDAKEGTTTGISAYDRAQTVRKLMDPNATYEDFFSPGHIFPLIAKEGGVLSRPGHTEASVDLARLAGLSPSAVICEVMDEDGHMMRGEKLFEFARKHDLFILDIAQLVEYRKQYDNDPLVYRPNVKRMECTGRVNMPSRIDDASFILYAYVDRLEGKEHIAVVYGEVAGKENVLVRVHSECLTGDVLHSARCDCGEQLDTALKKIIAEGAGVLVYLRQEGRGIGLVNKIKAYELQERGYDTVDANLKLGFSPDLRSYQPAAEILQDLGVKSIRIMTNNPMKVKEIQKFGVDISERVPLEICPREANKHYLSTKRERMGHFLSSIPPLKESKE